jgi:hypothetical protein
MAVGAVPLLEAAKCGDNIKKRGVVETIIKESSVVDQMPFIPIMGNALEHEIEGTLPVAQYRRVNETYTRGWGTDDKAYWGVTILGQEVFVDNFLIKTMGNVKSVKAKQWSKTSKSIGLKLDFDFIRGTGSVADKSFKGINALVDEGFGQYLANATNGGTLDLDKMDEAGDLLRTGNPDALFMNRTVRRRLTWKARNVSGQFPLIGVELLFGKKVTTYGDVPIRLLGDTVAADGTATPILPFDEVQGSSGATCSSIYFLRFGEDFVSGLLGAGGSFDVVDFGETEQAPGHLGRIELYPGLAIFNRYAVVRLGGIQNV